MNDYLTPHTSIRGFTVIELLLVVVILLVISAVTLPRFVGAEDHSHVERVEATATSLQAAIADVHTRWLSGGGDESVLDLAGYLGRKIDTNENGYPIGIDGGDGLTRAADCTHLWMNVLPNPPSAWHNEHLDSDYVVELRDGMCHYHYQRVRGFSIVYQPQQGQVRVRALSS